MVTVLSTVLSAVTIIYKKVKKTHKSLVYVQFTIHFKDYNYLNYVLEKFLKDVQDVDDKKEYYAIFILNLEKMKSF